MWDICYTILPKPYTKTKLLHLGGIAMNTTKESIGIKQLFESCFEATPSHIHHKTGQPHMANTIIIGRTIDLFEKNTETYMRHILNGTLIFTPNLRVLSETNHSMIK